MTVDNSGWAGFPSTLDCLHFMDSAWSNVSEQGGQTAMTGFQRRLAVTKWRYLLTHHATLTEQIGGTPRASPKLICLFVRRFTCFLMQGLPLFSSEAATRSVVQGRIDRPTQNHFNNSRNIVVFFMEVPITSRKEAMRYFIASMILSWFSLTQ